MESEKKCKIVLLGAEGVGKTSILSRFVTGDYKDMEPTKGAAFMTKLMQSESGEAIIFQIWDVAGQEKFRALAPMYYNGAKAAVIVYDITNKESFEVCKGWIKELQKKGPESLTWALVGNKSDLVYEEAVPLDDAYRLAEEIGAIFQLTSAKDDNGIKDLFRKLTEEVVKPPSIQKRIC